MPFVSVLLFGFFIVLAATGGGLLWWLSEREARVQGRIFLARWLVGGTGRRKLFLISGSLLANALFASFACAQPTLQHLDPLVFSAVQMGILLPVALVPLLRAHRPEAVPFIRHGLLGGCLLGLGFLCVALALRAIGILPTAMLTALDGLLASLIAWFLLRKPPTGYAVLAALSAGLGAVLLWLVAPGYWQSDLVALACGLAFTVYGFVVERSRLTQAPLQQWWPFFGALFCAMAGVTLALALCFGSWSSLRALTGTDLAVLLYASLATVAVPVVVLTLLLRHLSAVTLAFLALLEPLISLAFAYVLGSLSLAVPGWIGVGCIFAGLLLQMRAAVGPPLTTVAEAEVQPDPTPVPIEEA